MVLCLNLILLDSTVILTTGACCLHRCQRFSPGKVQCCGLSCGFQQENRVWATAHFLNGRGIRVNTAAMSSFWTLPGHKRGVPKGKSSCWVSGGNEQAPDTGQVFVLSLNCWSKLLKYCEARIYQCHSHACRWQESPFCSLGWNPKLIAWEEREMLVSSEESPTQLCCKLSWVPLLVWGRPYIIHLCWKYPEQTVLATMRGILTLGF